MLPQAAPDTTAAAPPDTTQLIDIGEINNAFSQAIALFLEGDFEGLYELLYQSAINLTGLLLGNGLQALLTFLTLYVIYWVIDRALHQVLDRSARIEAGLQSLLQRSYRVVAYVFIGAMVLSQLGVNVTALVAGLSIAGIAVGFAARDSMENFISGVTILVDEPFKVGDYIVVDDEYGQVHEITLRSTRIRTVRNEIMVLPNTQMITSRVVNHSKQNTLRIDIDFGIAYKEIPDEARQVLLPITEGDDRILPRPEPSVIVTEMADSSVNMKLRFYIRDASEELAVRWAYTEKVRETLREADIEIPFPHLQLFVDEAKAFADAPFMQPPRNGE
ncbi:MAG: mechanosensitive ion channel [Bacteroidetes bacterium]|jgi:small conductance mechanosensitive channel|nr:mechanosensitive ion channel [Bacteroidota bacterium]